jgi:ectoine hydroxylase-related dioxygenase (phytanoyl-CoA dioxygenase family)
VSDTTSDRHAITYRVLNHDLSNPTREVDVHASRTEIDQLVTRGYLVRERLFQGAELSALRTALDGLEAREKEAVGVSVGRRFGGLFLRHLMDKDEAFLRLLKYAPTLSIARATLGPLVQVRGLSARVSYPGEQNQETHWHFHHRVLSDPLPPFFCPPQALDCLIYLDELNDANGPVCVVPESHTWHTSEPPAEDYSEIPGQITVRAPAGTCVIIHSNLWHRAMPTRADGEKRRLLILSYTPTWMKRSPYGVKPPHGLTERALEDGDNETRELLGLGGYT